MGRPVLVDEPELVGDELLLSDQHEKAHGYVEGDLGGVRRVVSTAQKPIGRTPRSNVGYLYRPFRLGAAALRSYSRSAVARLQARTLLFQRRRRSMPDL